MAKYNRRPTDPKKRTVKSLLNPKNWGVKDYTSKGDFDSAYASAKRDGEKVFIWNNNRYSTKYAGTPRQEAGAYLPTGGLTPDEVNYPIQVDRYLPSEDYLVGHMAAQLTGNKKNPSIDYHKEGNYPITRNKKGSDNKRSYYVYGADREKFVKKSQDLPNAIRDEKSDYNLLTNNCADNVCDALDVEREKAIETPKNALKKIQSKYPTIDVTGRTIEDYKDMVWNLPANPDLLKDAKNLIGIAYSPDIVDTYMHSEIIKEIQRALYEEGYNLPKSRKKTKYGYYIFDGVMGEETRKALQDYNDKIKERSKRGFKANRRG